MANITKLQALFADMAGLATQYNVAADKVRKLRADGADIKDVQEACVAALVQKMPKYRATLQENGRFEKGSAGQKAFSRMMSDTNPEQGAVANQRKPVKVPAELVSAIEKLLTTYDKAQIKAAMAKFQ